MLVSAAWIGPAILGGLDVIVQQRIYGDGPVPIRAVIFVTGDWLLYGLLTPAVFAIARRWPLARPHLARRAVLHLLFSLLFCAAWAGSGTVLKALVDPPRTARRAVASPSTSSAGSSSRCRSASPCISRSSASSTRSATSSRRASARSSSRVSRSSSRGARFAALQAQLNPHFLFNTLNTVAVLVRDGDKTAARIVEQLSDVLRRTLTRHRTAEVTLAEELELVRQYLAIEQARFSDRLRPGFDIDEPVLSAAVPGFAPAASGRTAIGPGIDQDAGRVEVGPPGRRAGRDRASLWSRGARCEGTGPCDLALPIMRWCWSPTVARREWGRCVDDEPAARGRPQLLAAFPDFAVVGECRNGAEVLASLDALQPDVVFLDVQMPGIDGFEVIRRRTPERMPAVVFLTAYDQFALRAFEAEALDYLVKPVSEVRFAATMRRLTRQLRSTPSAREPRIVVTTARGAAVLAVRDIDWIEAADNYARIWTGGPQLSAPRVDARARGARPSARLRPRAPPRAGASRSVRELTWTAEGALVAVLGSGAKIHVSRRRRAAFAAAVRSQATLGLGAGG